MSGVLTDLQSLERFVAENDELLKLETRIGRFNIFDALGVVNAELRHSNFLAWLLDPGESHGLGGLFLRAVLMDLLRQTPVEQRLFSPIKLDGGELRGIEVRREWRNIDLLITCDDPSFVIAIENKIGSSEHSDQLARYKKIVSESTELSKYERTQFVYLTKEGDEPSEADWTVYSYADLYRVLSKVRAANADQMGDDVRAFLDHYLRLIGSRFMDDPEIIELCKEIYKNHRQAIDLIVEQVVSPQAQIAQTIADTVQSLDKWELINTTTRSVVIIHKSWRNMLPAIGSRKKFDPAVWLVMAFRVHNARCTSALHVWPTSDAEFRKAVVDRMLAEKQLDLKVFFKDTSNMGTRWATIDRKQVDKWKTETEPDPVRLSEKVQAHLIKRSKQLAKLPKILKSV